MTGQSDKTREETVEDLVRRIYGLGALRRELMRHALAELGTQGFTSLGIVHVHGPVRVSDVAARLGVDMSVASRQVNALVSAGYLTREPDPDDRRAHVLEVTEAGTQVLGESHRRMVHAFGRSLEGWTESEIETLTAGLGRLYEDFAARTDAPAHTDEGKEARR
jgi:DNA-binding MarR family transcriptional regulator